VIDGQAREMLDRHIHYLENHGRLIHRCALPEHTQSGTYFSPHVFEIDSIKLLQREVFGPILHVIRYASRDLDKVISDINDTGYGLTFGVHSRIEETIDYITGRIRAGNIYINRNIIGAVVGVQPFGGEALSGTGPKAGGPNYLHRFCTERTLSDNIVAVGGNADLLALND
jgi:RHH-type proline utilization regulon transcriptional repressor/proline dehydrogenase/delta 1-pyrroline-5-carboxylate dehydrogenase